MIWFILWLLGSFISWLCLLKVTKVKLRQESFNCTDLIFYGILALLGGPIGILSAGLIYLIEELSDEKWSSDKCKNLASWISKKI